ncbi:MAG: hypothetical protein H6737_00730 [Alphaproteobacteria bacterium]|nr:hypothetical protein [Alphaproteobacteria bacterium]
MKLPYWLPFALLWACSIDASDPFGGQEGEPLTDDEVPEPPPPAADPDFDGALDACAVAASCDGPGWCADYSGDTLPPDFEADCEAVGGVVSDTPCDNAENAGFCRDAESYDMCTVVWVYDDLAKDAGAFCEDLGLDFVSPRG